jgi:hypothetical protein
MQMNLSLLNNNSIIINIGLWTELYAKKHMQKGACNSVQIMLERTYF